MAKTKYSREELAVIIDKELKQALGAHGDELSAVRLRNLQYYQAQAVGELAAPEVPDRASIVATDVADTVESILPSLIRVFAASQEAVECEARTQQYEPQAKLASEYLRHIFWHRCNGFGVLHDWFKDGLIQKVGFVKIEWDKTPEDVERSFSGLLPEQVQGLLSDPSITVTEQAARTVSVAGQQVEVYDLKVSQRLGNGCAKVTPVPPEEMRIHPRARYGEEPLFIGQETSRTRAQLEAEGYDLTGISSGDPVEWSMSADARMLFGKGLWTDDSTGELERFRVAEGYIQLDQDDDGVPEWRRVFMIGDTVMEDDAVREHPFASFCPTPVPHAFFGLCPADQAIEPQRLNTSLMRALLDNTYLTVNQRTAVVEGRVNLDDLLVSRPGGLVRTQSLDALMPLQQPQLSPAAWQMVEWADQWRERRTGYTRYSQGLKADALSPQTAYGASVIAEKDDMRMELMARVAAESVRQMFEKLLRCMAAYQDVPDQVRLLGTWLQIDPRQWDDAFNIRVNVGLGVGNKDKRAAALMQVIQLQQPMIQAGIVDKESALLAAWKFADAAGLTDAQSYFKPAQPQPQQPPMELQLAQIKAQADQQAQAQEGQIELQKQAQQQQFEAAQSQLDRQTQIAVEQLRQNGKLQGELLSLAAGVLSAEAGAQRGPNILDGTTLDSTGAAMGSATPEQLDAVVARINQVASAFAQRPAAQ